MITTAQVSYKKKFRLQLAVHVLTPVITFSAQSNTSALQHQRQNAKMAISRTKSKSG